MDITTDILVTAVNKVIKSFEEKNSGYSQQDIADKANCAYTTLLNIKKEKLKSLSVKKSLEISKRLGGPESLTDLIYGEKQLDKDKINQRYSHLFEYGVVPENLEEYFHNKDFAKIVWAAFGSNHITRDEVRYLWGQEGDKKVDLLIESGLLKEEDGKIKGVSGSATFREDSVYRQLGLAYNLWNPENSKKPENWVSFQTNSVNDEFINDFREDLKDVFKKFNEKSTTSKYAGSKRVFFGSIFDRYLEDISPEKEVLQ